MTESRDEVVKRVIEACAAPPRSDTPETDEHGNPLGQIYDLRFSAGSKLHDFVSIGSYRSLERQRDAALIRRDEFYNCWLNALDRSEQAERERDAAVGELKQVGGSSALGWMQSARKWQQRAEQEQKDSDQGWQAFYALRKQVSADKYTELTNVVRALAAEKEKA